MLSVIIFISGETELIRWSGILKQSCNEQPYDLLILWKQCFQKFAGVSFSHFSVNVSCAASGPGYVY